MSITILQPDTVNGMLHMSIGCISYVHVGNNALTVFIKERPCPKNLEGDIMNLLSVPSKQADL